MGDVQADVEPCSIGVEDCTEMFEPEQIPLFFKILRLDKSVMIWIGDRRNDMSDLSFAIPTKFDDEPSKTSLYQGDMEGRTGEIVQQLSKMMDMPIWLSINAECKEEHNVGMLYEVITRKCIELLEKKPAC